MQIIHLNGFSSYEIECRKFIIYSNTIRSMLDLINALHILCIKLGNRQLRTSVELLENHARNNFEYDPLTPEIVYAVKSLWMDTGIQECFERRVEFQLNDSAQYFFENIDRISQPNYIPTNQDILRSRVPTAGVVKMVFELQGIQFNVFDVGGQRSQRRKWIHIFDDVNSIIFVAAISEYDQVIREDNRKNRLIEALDLFQDISQCPYFLLTNTILFLNKNDIFEEKIKKVCLSNLFIKYKGGHDYENAVNYIQKKFRARRGHVNKQLYIHITCATDTDQVEKILSSVLDMIVTENMRNSRMI